MGETNVLLRIPVLENLATQYGGAFAIRSRSLSEQERTVARTIFEQSLAYENVRIVHTNYIAAPTTLGNNIRIPPGYHLDNATLIHELTHIWQFQTKGNRYISDSAMHQLAGVLSSGDRNAAYAYIINPRQPFHLYTAEHQAMIVQDYYSNPILQTDPDYMRLIAEVRSARPNLTDMDRYMESLYGSSSQNPFQNNAIPGVSNDTVTGVVPIFRLEF